MATVHFLDKCKELGEDPYVFLRRHLACDWGDLTQEDKDLNEIALELEERLLSAYNLKDGTRIYIITEADRSATTLLLADEY